jgi:hypothetical protein
MGAWARGVILLRLVVRYAGFQLALRTSAPTRRAKCKLE